MSKSFLRAKVRNVTPGRRSQFIVIMIAIGLLGSTLLFISRAATQVASVEAEAGTNIGATQVTDNTASGNNAIKFAAGASGGGTTGAWWKPGSATPLPWQWVISGAFSTTNAGMMGTNSTLFNGGTAPQPVVYDIDAFENTVGTVDALHAMNKKAICYMEVGAAESGRSDYAQFQGIPGALGKVMPGYATEKYIDYRIPAVVNIIKSRIDLCASKHFDAIEPDIDDSYAWGSGETGFPFTIDQQVTYLSTLADYAHSKGMAWGLKNGGDTDDNGDFIGRVAAFADYALVEAPYGIYGSGTVSWYYNSFSSKGKAVFVAENRDEAGSKTTAAQFATFCSDANAKKFDMVQLNINYDGGYRVSCN